MLPSCCSTSFFFFFPFFLSNWRFLWSKVQSLLSARQPLSLWRMPLATQVCWLEFACCEQGSVGVSWLAQKVTKKLYKCQHLFLMISCCFHLFTYHTAISYNPTKLREGLNEAISPFFCSWKPLQQLLLSFAGKIHLFEACKFAVCQLLSGSLWTGKSLLNSVSHCCPLQPYQNALQISVSLDYRVQLKRRKGTKMGNLLQRYLVSSGDLMFLAPSVCNEEFFPQTS